MATPRKLKDYQKLTPETKDIMVMLTAAEQVIRNANGYNELQTIEFKVCKLDKIKKTIYIRYEVSDGT